MAAVIDSIAVPSRLHNSISPNVKKLTVPNDFLAMHADGWTVVSTLHSATYKLIIKYISGNY